MLTLYIVFTVVAGVLVLMTLLGADHGFEHEIHFDHDGEGGGHWVPFLSLRFYTYLMLGWGLTGLLLSLFTATPPLVAFWVSLAVGVLCGFGIAFTLHALRKDEATSSVLEKDVLGLEATVLVPIRGTSPGRIRCTVNGQTIDYLAICDDPEPLEPGASVIVVAFEGDRVLVMSRTALYSENAKSTTSI